MAMEIHYLYVSFLLKPQFRLDFELPRLIKPEGNLYQLYRPSKVIYPECWNLSRKPTYVFVLIYVYDYDHVPMIVDRSRVPVVGN